MDSLPFISSSAQDDIVLISRTAEGLQELLTIVQRHCSDLKMTLSVSKCKVMSNQMDAWVLFEGDEVSGCLDKVLTFKYLGIESNLSPSKGALAMRKRALTLAKKYKAACLWVSREGPDATEVALCTWLNIAIPSITFGCESVIFNETCLSELNRLQMGVGKEILGLPVCAPHVAVEVTLGLRSVKEVIYGRQLKFYLRLKQQESSRWSKDAWMDHLLGGWTSPYIAMISAIKHEVGMVRGPVSNKHVDEVLRHHFTAILNVKITNLGLPALNKVERRARADWVNETESSQVTVFVFGLTVSFPFLELSKIFPPYISNHVYFNLLNIVILFQVHAPLYSYEIIFSLIRLSIFLF